MENKPTLAFISHSFHKNTLSEEFFKKLLQPYFDITNYWDETWKKDKSKPTKVKILNKYDYVLFFQVLNPIKDLQKIKAKIIWIPMYDSERFSYVFWKTLSFISIKIISFSEKIHSQCQKFGIDSQKVQYFMNPDLFEKYRKNIPKKGVHIFFWYRGSLKFNDLKKYLDSNQIDSFTYKSNPDPKFTPEVISEEDIIKYKMKISNNGFIPKEDLLNIMSSANIFITPRKKEGIGMILLEALALGQCVIGYNEATTNEYLKNNKTGYLFDYNKNDKLKFDNINEIRKKSFLLARKGYSKWKEDEEKIVDFINLPYRSASKNILVKELFQLINNSDFIRKYFRFLKVFIIKNQ